MSEQTPIDPAPGPRSVMDRVVLGVIALMCALFGLPMVYSSGVQFGAMLGGVMPSLWAVALLPIGLGLVYAAIRMGMAAMASGKPQP
jgi:hypothetical protein